MGERPAYYKDRTIAPLLNLIEQRFGLSVDGPKSHLLSVQEHYCEKRKMLLAEHGESALAHKDYAKAFLISEAARMMILREILPRPKKRKNK